MHKLTLAHGTASPSQTHLHATTTPPSRRQSALAGLAGQLQSIFTELLAGEAYRHGIPPHLRCDVGMCR